MSKIDELLQLAYDEYMEVLHTDKWYMHITACMTLCLEYRYPVFKKEKNGEMTSDGYTWLNPFWEKQYKIYEGYREDFHKKLAADIQEKYHVYDVHKYEPKEKILEEAQKRYDYEKANNENLNIARSE